MLFIVIVACLVAVSFTFKRSRIFSSFTTVGDGSQIGEQLGRCGAHGRIDAVHTVASVLLLHLLLHLLLQLLLLLKSGKWSIDGAECRRKRWRNLINPRLLNDIRLLMNRRCGAAFDGTFSRNGRFCRIRLWRVGAQVWNSALTRMASGSNDSRQMMAPCLTSEMMTIAQTDSHFGRNRRFLGWKIQRLITTGFSFKFLFLIIVIVMIPLLIYILTALGY